MSANRTRRTKIVATVGPASREPGVLRELIDAGVDVFRLNFSHGTAADHAENIERIRAVAEEAGVEMGILGDLPGPKLRLGDLRDDVAVLHSGSKVVLHGDASETGDADRLPVQWAGISKAVETGHPIFLADGRVRLKVAAVDDGEVTAEVEAGGAVSSHQGVNLPGADAVLPDTGDADREWIGFACEQGIDLLAVSFVRRPADLGRGPQGGRGARPRHPADREDREAPGRRARRGDHRGGGRRDHGRPRRPRGRAADRGGAGRPEAADHPGGPGLEAVDHRDADAGDDGQGLAADPGGGHRRRERDPRRHRRRDAERGDGGRRAPRRDRARHGPDRQGRRDRPPLRRVALAARRGCRHRHRRGGRAGRRRRHLPPQPGGDRRPDRVRPNRPAGLGVPAQGPRARGVGQAWRRSAG